MSDGAETARVWLVERDYDDKGLVRLVYATPDGSSHLTRELSQQMLRRSAVTAAMTVERDRLEPVVDAETRDRYDAEADRMIAAHEPDDEV
jgi:hypothetical protein